MSQLPTILVVEDDQEVQRILEDALGESGFAPAITASGEEALTLLRGNRGKYHALVADIALRGRMTGWEVATQVRQIDPEFPVLYLTGGYAHQWTLRGVANSALLTKPFEVPQLVETISNLLDAGGPSRQDEAQQVAQEYADDQRGIIKKLHKPLN